MSLVPDYNTLFDFLEQKIKQIVQCVLWLAKVTINDDRFEAYPFPVN